MMYFLIKVIFYIISFIIHPRVFFFFKQSFCCTPETNTFLKFNLIYLFMAVLGLLFMCEGFLQLRQVGATLHRGKRASHYRGLSCCGAQAPDAQAQ